jgi:hypothetical protein
MRRKIDRNFSLGSHLKARDVKAVRKTVSGLVKLIYQNGELSKDDLAELVELSLEGRRRVKEQLKKMGSFEFHQTSFSLIDNETREEKFVGVPEQNGRDMISLDPLPPDRCTRLQWTTTPRSASAVLKWAALKHSVKARTRRPLMSEEPNPGARSIGLARLPSTKKIQTTLQPLVFS